MARVRAFLTYLILAAMAATIAAILTAALAIQLLGGEIPCPLCLIERVALFAAGLAALMNLRGPYSGRWTGAALLAALLLMIVAARQSLLDIYPRPGHAYVGEVVLGLHMPVWSTLIGLALIGANAAMLTAFGGDSHMRGHPAEAFPALVHIGRVLGLWLLVLALVNLVAVVLQCGLGQCHTSGYALLG
jgi:disulfide bond formation protein DsbB